MTKRGSWTDVKIYLLLYLALPGLCSSPPPRIIEKLQFWGITGGLLSFPGDYLHGRTLQAVLNVQSSSEHPMRASVPQGSVLGPSLWNIYYSDILQLTPQAQAYADDCTLWPRPTSNYCQRNQPSSWDDLNLGPMLACYIGTTQDPATTYNSE